MKRISRWSVWTVGALVTMIVVFLLAAWVGSSIPRNSEWTQPDGGVEIMVETNGIHTGIVMPILTPQKDWSVDFPASDIPAAGRPYTHVSVSWGEREVFLDTPTWADLSPSTALRAAVGGDGLLHVAHYVRPASDTDVRVLRISAEQYARLVRAIEKQVFAPDQRPPLRGYDSYDVFYDAPGTYHLGNTCNQWTSDTLAAAGIRIGWWTPLPGGVMKWIPDPAS